jgi:hypothetical protein
MAWGRASGSFASLLLLTLVAGAAFSSEPYPMYPMVVELEADRDNTLFETSEDSTSSGAGTRLYLKGPGESFYVSERRRFLLHFDLEGSIPPGTTILSAELRLTLDKTDIFASGPILVSLHRVTRDWGEGSSDAGVPGGEGTAAATGDATWLHTFYSDLFWTIPGGDFDATPSATAGVGTTLTGYSWGSTPELVSDVQAWRLDSASNFGWLLTTDVVDSGRRFYSRESEPEGEGELDSNRPTLILTLPEPAGPGSAAAVLVVIAALRSRQRPAREPAACASAGRL